MRSPRPQVIRRRQQGDDAAAYAARSRREEAQREADVARRVAATTAAVLNQSLSPLSTEEQRLAAEVGALEAAQHAAEIPRAPADRSVGKKQRSSTCDGRSGKAAKTAAAAAAAAAADEAEMAAAGGAQGGSAPGAGGVTAHPSPELTSLLALRLEDLKARCRDKGLAVYGSKQALAERPLSGKPRGARGPKPACAFPLHAPTASHSARTAPTGAAAADEDGSGGEEEEEEEEAPLPELPEVDEEKEPDAELLARVEAEAMAAPAGA